MATSNTQDDSQQNITHPPLVLWWPGFDYIFGYQMKMVKHFWGLTGRS